MNHPNKAPFTGVLAFVDIPSDKPPSGARGHRVLLTQEAAKHALDSLIGMEINVSNGDAHRIESKVGVIETAELCGDKLLVSGYLYRLDFPAVVASLNACMDNGMSYEIVEARIDDMRADVWKITRMVFTGACVLPRSMAAYALTEFRLIDRA